jgi:hypothetical protein
MDRHSEATMEDRPTGAAGVVGGVDTHKDLHVSAVVDERDQVLGTRSFAAVVLPK